MKQPLKPVLKVTSPSEAAAKLAAELIPNIGNPMDPGNTRCVKAAHSIQALIDASRAEDAKRIAELEQQLSAAQAAGAEMRKWIEKQGWQHSDDCTSHSECVCGGTEFYENLREILDSTTLGVGFLSKEEADKLTWENKEWRKNGERNRVVLRKLAKLIGVELSDDERTPVEQITEAAMTKISTLAKERDEAKASAIKATRELTRVKAEIARKDEALRKLIGFVTRGLCMHEETRRGGLIWTICDHCGRKWADDEGGFQPYQEPKEITEAYAALSPAVAETAAPEVQIPEGWTLDETGKWITREGDGVWLRGEGMEWQFSRSKWFGVHRVSCGTPSVKGCRYRMPCPETPKSGEVENCEAIQSVLAERKRQDAKWGEQNHDPITWVAILTEEVGEFSQAALHSRCGGAAADGLREEAAQCAAVALQIVQCLDRGKWAWPPQSEGKEGK